MAIFLPALWLNISQAKMPEVLPERAGLYAVPGRPELKLRVFEYPAPGLDFAKKGQRGKPPALSPQEVCDLSSRTDPDSSAVVSGAGWKLPDNWEYNLNPTSVPMAVGADNLASISSQAFSAWLTASAPLPAAVNIQRGPDITISRAVMDGQNIIAWGRASGGALAVSYVWYNKVTGLAVEVDTIMNEKFSWSWSNPDSWPVDQSCAYEGVYDAQNILTHELGHTFGLDDEYGVSYLNNTMYGYGSKSETKKDTLTSGDKTGLGNLY